MIILTVGLPYSGKSTYIDTYMVGYNPVVLCPDDFRWAIYGHEFYKQGEPFVWACVEAAARACVRRNQDVLIDATNTTRAARSTWVRLAKEFDIPIKAVVFNTPVNECLKRANDAGAYHMESVILRMYKQWEAIDSGELFDDIVVKEYNG